MDNVDRMYRQLARTVRSRFPHYLTQPFEVGELYQTILPYRHHRRELGLDSNEDYEITLTELLSGAREYLIVDDRMADVLRAELASVNPDPSAFKQFASSMVALAPGALRGLEAGPADELSPPRASTPIARMTPTPTAAPTAAPSFAAAPPLSPSAIATAPAAATAVPAASAAPTAPPPRTSVPTAAPPNDMAERSTSMSPVRTPAQLPGMRTSPPGGTRPGFGTLTPQPGDSCPACDESLPPGRPITFCPFCGQNITVRNCPACGSELEVGWKFCPACGRPAAAH